MQPRRAQRLERPRTTSVSRRTPFAPGVAQLSGTTRFTPTSFAARKISRCSPITRASTLLMRMSTPRKYSLSFSKSSVICPTRTSTPELFSSSVLGLLTEAGRMSAATRYSECVRPRYSQVITVEASCNEVLTKESDLRSASTMVLPVKPVAPRTRTRDLEAVMACVGVLWG